MSRAVIATSFVLIAGCTGGLWGSPAVSSASRATPAPSDKPDGLARAPGRIAVLDQLGKLTVFDADGSDPIVLDATVPGETVVRQPAWSPDGDRIAWVEASNDGVTADVIISATDGRRPTDTPIAAAAFYLSWDPTSSRIAYLGSQPAKGIELGLVEIAASTAVPIAGGSPLYLSWDPSGNGLLVHVGTDRLDRLTVDGSRTAVGARPGMFTAPVWTTDGRTLIYAAEIAGGQGLIAHDVRTDEDRTLVRFRGTITFVVSPDGRRVAFQVLHGATLATPLSVIDRRTGKIERVATDYEPAFFWSPTGAKLLQLVPDVTPERIWFRWGVWEDGSTFTTGRFVPSLELSRDYLQFFEQYAQSMALWAPDDSAFVYAGESESGETGVWIQPAIEGAAPVFVGDGVVATWSPA